MRIDVVDPSVLHRFLGIWGVEGGEDAFDTAELGEGVDAVGAEAAEEKEFVGLRMEDVR